MSEGSVSRIALALVAVLVAPSALDAQIVCPRGVDCAPQPWRAEAIQRAAPVIAGCWSFQLGGGETLQSPFSEHEYEFPLSSDVELTLEETSDVWPDFEGVRHEVAFRVRAGDLNRAAYWIPDPDGEAFLIKWREEASAAGHLVVRASLEGISGNASVSEPGHHFGLMLRPSEVLVERCEASLG